MERADVDKSPCFGLTSSSSLMYSTPSQNLSDLVSQILETSSSVQEPLIQSHNLTPTSLPQELSSSITSPFCVEAVTAGLNSFVLSDDVFLETNLNSKSGNLTSTASEEASSSCFIVSEGTESSNSSDGIRGVWYYLSSSRGSSEASHSTTMPQSSFTSSSYVSKSCEGTTDSSASELCSESSRSMEEALRVDPEVLTLSDISSSESDFIAMSEQNESVSVVEVKDFESHALKREVKRPSESLSDLQDKKVPSAVGRRGIRPDVQEMKIVDFKNETGGSDQDDETRGVCFKNTYR